MLAEALNARGLAGVAFRPVSFTPTSSVYAGQLVGRRALVVTDREALRTVTVGLAVARELMERYPGKFRPAAIQNLLVNRSTIWALLRGDPLARILELGRRGPRRAFSSAARRISSTSSAAAYGRSTTRAPRPAPGLAGSAAGGTVIVAASPSLT